MPWYRTGTVAITAGQTTVTGTGTNFALNSRVGDAFQGPDGRWYEVANVASATVLSILPAYQGATVAAGAYGLAPMQGYVKESADRLRQLVDQIGSTFALFGGAATSEALRQNIMAATRGANSDITSLSGLTTALSVAQGGTGGKTQAEARGGIGAIGVGEYGIGTTASSHSGTMSGIASSSLFQFSESYPGEWASTMGSYPMGVNFYRSSAVRSQLAISYGAAGSGAGVYYRQSAGSGLPSAPWIKLMESGDVIGVSQAWAGQSRALNTNYVNNTGRPIQLSVLCGPTSGVNVVVRVTIGGVTIPGVYAAVAGQYVCSPNVIIPPGATYSVAVANGTAALYTWQELS